MYCLKALDWIVSRTAYLFLIASLGSSQAVAAIIATESFESYSVGDDISMAGVGTGGSGWSGDWGATTFPTSLSVESNVIPANGRGLLITNQSSGDNNLLFRQFPVQTGDIYVGLSLNHYVPAGGDDFLHFYFNDSTGNTPNDAVGGGVFRGADQVGNYTVRIGGNGSDNVGGSSTYDVDQTLVLKLSKGGGTDYDQVSLWANQATEGIPDAILNSGDGNALTLEQISTIHLRWTPLSQLGVLKLDNLVIATTFDEALTLVNNPIPEPSTLLLVGLGWASVPFRRRR